MGFEDDQKQQKDLEDNEAAGREGRWLDRILGDPDADAKREAEARALLSPLGRLLEDPEYKHLCEHAWHTSDLAQSTLDRALIENAQAHGFLSHIVEGMENNAATLANGEKVFRSENGGLRTASGHRVTGAEARNIEIPPNAPSYETYVQANDALDRVRQRSYDLSEIQTTRIDPARERLQDENNPPSKRELREITQELERATTDANRALAPRFQAAASQAPLAQVEPSVQLATLNQTPTF